MLSKIKGFFSNPLVKFALLGVLCIVIYKAVKKTHEIDWFKEVAEAVNK